MLSREGASNRINGVVILDISTPAHPKIASTFDQELTGGVHNMFATNDYLFAVSGGGQKYVIIDVKDITKPKYVSEYEHPDARLHDLWVHDGIAYSAQGGAGTVVVDVGNGKYGGTIEQAEAHHGVSASTRGHEIYPYFQKSTGKIYLFIGDEEMNRQGRVWEGTEYQLSGPGGVPPRNGVRADVGRVHAHHRLHGSDASEAGRRAIISRTTARTTSSSRTTCSIRRTTTAACGWWTCRVS